MADNYYGSIRIPTRYLTRENKLLIDQKSGLTNAIDGLTLDDDRGGISTYSDELAHNGRFEELEDALVELGIPFDRASSAYYEYMQSDRYFRPGVCDREVQVTEHDGEYIPLEKVKELLKIVMDEDKGRDDAQEAIKKFLAEHGSDDIPPLEDYTDKGAVTNGEDRCQEPGIIPGV